MAQRISAKKQKESPAKNNLRNAGIALAMLLLCCVIGWAWQAYAKNKIYRDAQNQALAMLEDPATAWEVDDLRSQLPIGYIEKFETFTRNQREEREDQRMRDFFAKSRDEQNAELDRQIAEEERRNREREASRQQREAERAARGNSSNSQQGRGQGGAGNSGAGNQSAGQGQNGGGGGGFGGGGRGLLSSRLDRGSPIGRSMRSAYSTMAAERRAAAGLPPERAPRQRF